ncbi:MAG TPA: hypothetical protein VFG54_11405 [Prolixibacteraceae bacterium]|nr:hypothetical protein [Prolixibacteraceae bacterium]
MKNYFALGATAAMGAMILVSSFAFTQNQDKKKTRHVKLTKVENGKTMHLDTMLSGDDVFIWNGDTINPEKHIREFSPSGFDRLHNTDKMDRQKRTRIYKGGAGRDVDHMILHSDSGEDFHILTEEWDSVGKKIRIHKRLRDGNAEDHLIYLNERGGRHIPGAPPVPPVPHIRQFRHQNSAKGINLNDPNVISYKKKDIGGGREKIEIIRKKTNETDNFDFEMDHLMPVPEPPAPPVVDEELTKREEKRIEKQSKKVEKQQQKAEEKKDSLENQ